MKATTLTFAITGLVISMSAVAYDVNEPRDAAEQTPVVTIASASRTTQNRIQKQDPKKQENKIETSASNNTPPDPAYMPYINGLSE